MIAVIKAILTALGPSFLKKILGGLFKTRAKPTRMKALKDVHEAINLAKDKKDTSDIERILKR